MFISNGCLLIGCLSGQTLIPLLIDSCIILLGSRFITRVLCACNKSFQIGTEISHIKSIYINKEIRTLCHENVN